MKEPVLEPWGYTKIINWIASLGLDAQKIKPFKLRNPLKGVGDKFDGTDSNGNSPYASNTQLPPSERKVQAYKISDGGAPKKVRVVITAGVHARELAPSLAATTFLVSLVDAHKKLHGESTPFVHAGEFMYRAYQRAEIDEQGIVKKPSGYDKNVKFHDYTIDKAFVDNILKSVDIYFVPVVNPDGRDFVLGTEDETDEELKIKKQDIRTLWRKNRQNLADLLQGNQNVNGYYGRIDLTNNRIMKYDLNSAGQPDLTKPNPTYPVKVEGKTPDMYPIGIDIGRNTPIAWKAFQYYKSSELLKYQTINLKRSLSPSSADLSDFNLFRGVEPLSAPEAKNIIDLFEIAVPDDLSNNDRTYNETLFYIDLHQQERAIYGSWQFAQFNLQRNDSGFNYLNSSRDSDARPDYFNMPAVTYFSTTPKLGVRDGYSTDTPEYYPTTNYRLRIKNTNKFEKLKSIEKTMIETSSAIINTIFEANLLDVDNVSRAALGDQSRYTDVVEGVTSASYLATGSLSDYAFSLNVNYNLGSATNAQRKGPVIAFTAELGHENDGGFAPLDRYDTDNGSVEANHFRKVEREVWATLQAFLLKAADFSRLDVPQP